jgi:hypothetical protein
MWKSLIPGIHVDSDLDSDGELKKAEKEKAEKQGDDKDED